MYKYGDWLVISTKRMLKNSNMYSIGRSVVFKTKGVWLSPVSMGFFRLIKYSEARFLVEFVVETIFGDVCLTNSKIQQVARVNNFCRAKELLEKNFEKLLSKQSNNIKTGKFITKSLKLIYETESIPVMNSIFGSNIKWAVIKDLNKNEFKVYTLASSKFNNDYRWIELNAIYLKESLAKAHAKGCYQDLNSTVKEVTLSN